MGVSNWIDKRAGGRMKYLYSSLSRRKTIQDSVREAGDAGQEHGTGLKRCLKARDLTAFGVGSMIGAGIFVITGKVAAENAGPAIIISYLLAGVACAFAALCYAELACRVPSTGSAYSYSYITIGEFVAWTIGWDLTLEYMVASATVARGWSGYFKSLLHSIGFDSPSWLLPINIGLSDEGINLDPLAAFSVFIVTIILAVGVKESIKLASVMVVVKVVVIMFVIGAGASIASPENWHDFAPYGFQGISSGAAVIFFAYLGFDMVVNVAEETENPQRDLPIGILASLGISTALYIGVSAIVTMMTLYSEINIDSPLASAFALHGWRWAEFIISIGAFCGLTTAQITGLLSQPRLYYSLGRDGLLPPWFLYIHPRFQTPFNATIFSGLFCAIIAFVCDIKLLGDMSSIGTLLAFTIVAICTLMLRYNDPPKDSSSSSNFSSTASFSGKAISTPSGGFYRNIILDDSKDTTGDAELETIPPPVSDSVLTTQTNKAEEEREIEGKTELRDNNESEMSDINLDNANNTNNNYNSNNNFSRHKWLEVKRSKFEIKSPEGLIVTFIVFSIATFTSVKHFAHPSISVILLIFTLAPAGMMFFLQPKNIPTSFKCPGMPLVPILSIFFNIYLMVNLTWATWVRLIGWLLIGLAIYLFYGIKRSKLSERNYVTLNA